MRVDELEATLDRLDAEGRRPKFIYTIPNFQNPAGVTLSLPRRRRLVEVAKERELLVLEDNPYGLLRYEGDPLPTLYALDRGEFVIYLGTFSKILSPGIRLGWTTAPAPGAREDEPRQAGRRPVLVGVLADVRRHLLRARPLAGLPRSRCATSTAAGATRCSTRSPSTSRARRRGRGRRAACSSGPRCPTTSTRPTCSPARCRTTSRSCPAARAYLDGRGGSSMRLNFSGVSDDDIREGVRRIGEVVREQVGLYGDAHRRGARAAPAAARARRAPDPDLADVLHLPAAAVAGPRAPTPDEPRRGPQGRGVARAPGVAALGRAGRGRPAAPRPRGHPHRRRRRPRRAAARRGARRRVRRHARPRRRGRHRAGAARDPRHPVHRRRACRPACAAPTRSSPSTRCADAGLPTPAFYSFTETAFKRARGGRGAGRRSRSGSSSRSSSSPPTRAARSA